MDPVTLGGTLAPLPHSVHVVRTVLASSVLGIHNFFHITLFYFLYKFILLMFLFLSFPLEGESHYIRMCLSCLQLHPQSPEQCLVITETKYMLSSEETAAKGS